MITGDIKQKVDAVWQTFWNKGFTNTSAIFEQITYLLFMKMLDDKQLEKEAIANLIGDLLLNPTFPDGMWHNPTTDQDVPYNEMRWHVFKEMEPTKMLNRVRNDVFIFLRYVGKEGSACGCFSRAGGVLLSCRTRFSQAMHKPIRRYALRWWTTIACKLSSRCLRGCSSLTAGFPPPSSFLRKQVQVEQTRSGFTICVPMDSRLPHNALHNPNKTIFPMSSPVSTTSKRKPTAAAKSNRSLLLPMRFVPTATTSVINVITRWSVKLSNMKLRKRLSLEWRKGRRLLMRPLQSLRNR